MQVADICRMESSSQMRMNHLERLLGVPLLDPTGGLLGFAHSRRYRPCVLVLDQLYGLLSCSLAACCRNDRTTFECLRYLFALAEVEPGVGTYVAGLTADIAVRCEDPAFFCDE